jgi:hypothetical protein
MEMQNITSFYYLLHFHFPGMHSSGVPSQLTYISVVWDIRLNAVGMYNFISMSKLSIVQEGFEKCHHTLRGHYKICVFFMVFGVFIHFFCENWQYFIQLQVGMIFQVLWIITGKMSVLFSWTYLQ